MNQLESLAIKDLNTIADGVTEGVWENPEHFLIKLNKSI